MSISLSSISRSIQRLDECIFNHGGKQEKYRGTTAILYLPVIIGMACGGLGVLGSFGFGLREYSNVNFLKPLVFGIWFANEVFLIGHVFSLQGIFRKFFYPVFVTAITIPAFLLSYAIAYTVVGIAIVIIGIIVIAATGAGAMKNSGSSAPRVSMPSSSSGSNDTPKRAESVEVDDGSCFGRRLERNEGSNTWTDNSGKRYERNWDGSFTEL